MQKIEVKSYKMKSREAFSSWNFVLHFFLDFCTDLFYVWCWPLIGTEIICVKFQVYILADSGDIWLEEGTYLALCEAGHESCYEKLLFSHLMKSPKHKELTSMFEKLSNQPN